MSGFKEDWEEVRHGAERKPRAESRRNRWNGGNKIRYGGGRSSEPAGRAGFHGNPKLEGVIFDVLGNASKMAVRFKICTERCSEYAGSEFKDDPAGAAAAIRNRSAPTNIEPKKPTDKTSEINVIIWKDEYTKYKKKERVLLRKISIHWSFIFIIDLPQLKHCSQR